MISPEVIQNQTGAEMLNELTMLDGVLAVGGLTTDARTPIEAKRGEVHTKFARAAKYAVALATETGVEFDNPLKGLASTEAITLETLTPEEQAYKEAILEGLGVSRNSYSSVMDAMNSTKARKQGKNKLSVATETEARTALEAVLTPAMIRAEMAQIAEFTANPEQGSPEAGFDTLFITNKSLTADDETALANHLQGKLTAHSGKAYTYEPLHNGSTAHVATSSDAKVLAVRVPKHLNVRKAENTAEQTAVDVQKTAVEAHNNNPDTTYKLQMASDLEALTHIALLIDTNAIDTTNPNYDEKRFWSSYYKNVLAAPVDGCVSDVYVGDDGRLCRSRSDVDYDDPSRALVVPKA